MRGLFQSAKLFAIFLSLNALVAAAESPHKSNPEAGNYQAGVASRTADRNPNVNPPSCAKTKSAPHTFTALGNGVSGTSCGQEQRTSGFV